jgi:hypothetical protein
MHKYLQTNNVRVLTFGKVGACIANQNALRQVFSTKLPTQCKPWNGGNCGYGPNAPERNVIIEFSDRSQYLLNISTTSSAHFYH